MRPPRSRSFPVAAEEQAVPKARRLVLSVVRAWDLQLPDETLEELALLSSEVIANAVRHTTGPCAVTVLSTGSRLRIEVTDTAPALPAPRGDALYAESGRGLMLVASLAADWGSTVTGTGKAVWFEIAVPHLPQAPARPAC
ncbi:ATP-binding protein [Streptomyces sp. NBC_01142]|uniref:ATP-binding protein n=1 Tax=Streptomyces sp. NBC_01142 TaxID=2975865 RepID=UPI002253C329|nr:ATP-binding protein [Streptomyces sp. NBC_01142]MCX4825828.1 ATP-binding protein [Streptomyces sp. NBC_01142]